MSFLNFRVHTEFIRKQLNSLAVILLLLHNMATGYRLVSAVSSGDLKSVKDLIASFGLYYSPSWLEGYALLIDALKNQHTDIARELLAHGSKVNSKNKKYEDTPLHLAVKNGDLEIIKLLLEKGANVSAEDSKFMTTLHLAAFRQEDELSAEIIKLLLGVHNYVDATNIDKKTSLHVAVEAGNFNIVKCLLDHGASVHSRCNSNSFEGGTVLHLLTEKADHNCEDMGNIFLIKGADINAQTDNGTTPLHVAASRGCLRTTEFLLNNKALVDSCTFEDGMRPIHFAISEGHEGVVELLLKYGAKINFKGTNAKTVLYLAVDTGNDSIVKLILKYHPDIDNENNRVSLYHAIVSTSKYKGPIIVNDLCQYGYCLTKEEMSNCELLHGAVERGCFEIVENILQLGIHDINTVMHNAPRHGKSSLRRYGTPLHTAAKNNQHRIAELLITHGADVNVKDDAGKTPLFYSIQAGDGDLLKLLLKEGAKVEDPELLLMAILTQKENIVHALLDYNIDVNAPGVCGDLPLLVAVLSSSSLAKTLLDLGANPNGISKSGTTALHIAAESERDEAVTVLLKYGADPNIQDNHGNTPLHKAVTTGDNDIVENLLRYDADTNIKNEKGQTPLHLAAGLNNEFIVVNLLEYGGDINIEDNCGHTALDSHESKSIGSLDHSNSSDGFESDEDCECDYYDFVFCQDIYEALHVYVIMLKTANLPVSEHNLKINSSYIDRNDMATDCLNEVNIMKVEKVCNNITFYDILTKNVDQVAVYARNIKIVDLLTQDYSEKFPIYSCLIENAFNRGFQRNRLMKNHNELFTTVFPNLPLICKEEIFSYLNNQELKNFINASNFSDIKSKCSISTQIDAFDENFCKVSPRKLHGLYEILL